MLFRKLKKFFKKIEDDNKPIIFYIGSFISILIIRNFLEVIAYKEPVSLINFLHYSLFWVYLALLLGLVINIATSKKLKQIGRVLTSVFPVILLPPLIDTIFYGRNSFNITYLLPQHFEVAGVFDRFIKFTGSFSEVGISLGMKIEIFLILAFIFLYTYCSKKNIWKSAWTTFLTYCLLFFSLSLATLAGYYLNFLDIEVTHLVISQVLLILIFILILSLTYKNKKEIIKNHIKNFSGFSFLAYILVFNAGLWLAATKQELVIKEIFFSYIFSILAILLFSTFWRRLKQLNEEKFNIYSFLIFVIYLIFGAFGGEKVFFFTLVFLGVFYLYNYPPFKLKNVPFLSKLVLFFHFSTLFILGYSLVFEIL